MFQNDQTHFENLALIILNCFKMLRNQNTELKILSWK